MRRADAPSAGWYPDPQNRTELRWWDGLDWTSARRPVPSQAELRSVEHAHTAAAQQASQAAAAMRAADVPLRMDPTALAEEARRAARSEVDRTAQRIAQQAQAARREFEPLITEYTNRVVRWVKLAAVLAFTFLVLWILWQVFAQATLFEWIGDRIDNFTDDQTGAFTTTPGVYTSGLTPGVTFSR